MTTDERIEEALAWAEQWDAEDVLSTGAEMAVVLAAALREARERLRWEYVEPREGMLTVYDHNGKYRGCIGAASWDVLIAEGDSDKGKP